MQESSFYSPSLQAKLERFYKDLNTEVPISEIAKQCLEILTIFHQEMDAWKPKNTSNICKAECAHCCNHWVDGLDAFEALGIYSQIRKREDFADLLTRFFERETLFERLSIGSSNYDTSLDLFFKSNQRCPTLSSQNKCEIYSFRPIICSLYQAKHSYSLCKPDTISSSLENNEIISIDMRHQKVLAQIDSKLSHFNIPESYFQAMLHLFKNESLWQ